MNRRRFLGVTAGMAAASLLQSVPAGRAQSAKHTIRAVAFDGFVIFNPSSVVKRIEEVWPGRGTEVASAWRTHQFEYSWLRTAGRKYVDFWRITQDALAYAANSLKLGMTSQQRNHLMEEYRQLPVWPDVSDGLAELRRRQIKMVFLSNLTASMLDDNLSAAKLRDYFEGHLTTDLVRAYKPSPLAYEMGINRLRLEKGEIAFVASAAWDAAGAKWFGYPTVWINRSGAPVEELDSQPDVIAGDLSGLMNFVRSPA